MEINSESLSKIEIAYIRGRTRVVSCKSILPLKIIPLKTSSVAHIVLSNYGGGMVEGDSISLKISALENTKFFLTSQSNGRIFKSLNSRSAFQYIKGELGKNAFGIVFPDPMVPHENSNFQQHQEWHLEKTAVLLTTDWFSSGRSECGEVFLFSEYSCQTTIFYNHRLLLNDHSTYTPGIQKCNSPGVFGQFHHFITGFLAGDEQQESFIILKDYLINSSYSGASAIENRVAGNNQCIIVSDHVKEGLVAFRAMAKRRLDLTDFIKGLSKLTEKETLLSFNFTDRKF